MFGAERFRGDHAGARHILESLHDSSTPNFGASKLFAGQAGPHSATVAEYHCCGVACEALTVYGENVYVSDRIDVAPEVLRAGKDVDGLEERLVVPKSVERVHQVAVFLRQSETKGTWNGKDASAVQLLCHSTT